MSDRKANDPIEQCDTDQDVDENAEQDADRGNGHAEIIRCSAAAIKAGSERSGG